ncbi:methionyl-tRNA formyltransferase [Rhodovibrio salinarum]|uniref:Methionyl-tRNA formyltransferase n=1 Tax=Rhodovibrio salinarum TaxID=1087 RepID=A0A934QHE2_9PROT|nr:methionyl-tRNA formyltransferase [Rhodovibrio salinarum]MBK1696828.1 methionyl-tRNA formyltransferase [Rhodovibrio salinarum]
MADKLRLAFMGTPDFALPTLRALVDAGHEVVCVYTQPPAPAGRGHKVQPSPVQQEAEARGIEVRTPASLKDADAQQAFADLKLDAAVVVAYGLILPQPILEAPRLGCINVHASLLPRWRGAAPIQRAILAGDSASGISIMQMDSGLDTGPVLARERTEITHDTDAGQLHDTLAEMGAKLIVPTLEKLAAGELTPEPQPEKGATYAAKLSKDDRKLHWHRPAIELERLIRAFAPIPGAVAKLPAPKDAEPNAEGGQPDGETLKVLRARIAGAAPTGTPPGTVMNARDFTVATGLGCLKLVRVQRGGKNPMDAEEFLRGTPLKQGTVLP